LEFYGNYLREEGAALVGLQERAAVPLEERASSSNSLALDGAALSLG